MINEELIDEAAAFLRGRIRRTPIEHSPALSAIAGVPVSLKLENLQATGSFKIRGAWFRLSKLTAEERRTGILTCSAGNHGKGIAYAAKAEGIRATICVPRSIDPAKLRGIRQLGGADVEVRISEFEGYDDTQAWAFAIAAHEQIPFVHAYEDHFVMAGNGGTLAREIFEDVPDVRNFLIPVGGGGMIAGFTVAAASRDATIIGCQLEASPALKLSIDSGVAVTTLPAVETAAGGLEGGLGAQTFAVMRGKVDRVALIAEDELRVAVRWLLDEHQYLMEPSAGVTIAAILTGKCGPLTAPTVAVVSGRNVNVALIEGMLAS